MAFGSFPSSVEYLSEWLADQFGRSSDESKVQTTRGVTDTYDAYEYDARNRLGASCFGVSSSANDCAGAAHKIAEGLAVGARSEHAWAKSEVGRVLSLNCSLAAGSSHRVRYLSRGRGERRATLERKLLLSPTTKEELCAHVLPRSLAASAAPGRESAAARWEAGNGGDGSR